jgi:hypothetical protein
MLKSAVGFVVDRSPRGGGRMPPRVEQDETEWCWAACLQILVGDRRQQCEVAEMVLGRNPGECCARIEPCNFPLQPEDVVDALDAVGLRGFHHPNRFSPNRLSRAVGAGPVAIGLIGNASGHMLLAIRVSRLDTVDILDPWLEDGSVDYQYLLDGHPLGDWSHTWSDIR